jgi:hypothetical protein
LPFALLATTAMLHSRDSADKCTRRNEKVLPSVVIVKLFSEVIYDCSVAFFLAHPFMISLTLTALMSELVLVAFKILSRLIHYVTSDGQAVPVGNPSPSVITVRRV